MANKPPEPSNRLLEPRPDVNPGPWTPTTTTVQVILSDTSGLHTTLVEVTLTTPPPQHVLVTTAPTHISPLNHHPRPLTPSLTDPALVAPTALDMKLNKVPHTLITLTRAHNITLAQPTKTAWVNPQWPQVGTVVAESEIPKAWRETYEVKALRRQYGALGTVCGIFVLGVLGVLALGWWKCWWNGECVCSRNRKRSGVARQRFAWYG